MKDIDKRNLSPPDLALRATNVLSRVKANSFFSSVQMIIEKKGFTCITDIQAFKSK